MPEIGLWHAVRDAQPTRLLEEQIPLEKDLEQWIFDDPTLISPTLHGVRRQVPLGGKAMDMLAIEEPGVWVVCEFKKGSLYREALAQAIDYVTRLDMLSAAELRALVANPSLHHAPETLSLINKALDRETRGEERSIRVVLAGVGAREDLQRMVDYLSTKHSFPISVCTFSAVAAPGDDQGIILMRDVSEDIALQTLGDQNSPEYEDKLLVVRQYFNSTGQLEIFDLLVSEFTAQVNFFVRPWNKSIMITPHQHHGRYIAYFTANKAGIRATVGIDAISEFFPDADLSHLTSDLFDVQLNNPAEAAKWASTVTDTVKNVSTEPVRSNSTWNGSDWYFAFGAGDGRKWEDAVVHGFVCAGGGEWYSKSLKNLPIGARIFAYIPKEGYVGVGVTTGLAVNYLQSDYWKSQSLSGNYTHENGEPEYFVPVKWIKTLQPSDALYGNGLFASQNSTCKLRHTKTLKFLTEKFGVPFLE